MTVSDDYGNPFNLTQRSVSVQTTCRTFDEALSWVVHQVDSQRLERPNVRISPLIVVLPGDEDEGEYGFDVMVGASTTTDKHSSNTERET